MVLRILLLICITYGVSGQMNAHDYLQAFREDLLKATNDVMELQDEPQNFFPEFNMPMDFMHSFIPDTGVGNREDLVIDAIRSVPVYYDDSYLSWRYERFNNSDYVMGLHRNHLFLWKTSLTDKLPFQFSSSDTIFQYTSENRSIILDAVMFSRYVLHLERLYVAILSKSYRSSIISIFEIVDSTGIMVTVVDLNDKAGKPKTEEYKLAYVQSQHAGSLVLLINSHENKLVYQKKGSSQLSHYIEVHCQSAVDLATFSVNGHGYIAVASKYLVEVFKMNDFLQNHITFERFPYSTEVTDLEYFRLGFHHYLAVSALKYQTLYLWKRGGFFSKQEFAYPEGRQWFSALLPTCRDDIILFLVQGTTTEVFVWDGRTEKFAIVKNAIPSGFSPHPGSMTSFSYNTTAFVLYAQSEANTSIFSITTHLKPVGDPALVAGKEAAMVMKQLQATIEQQEAQLKNMETILAFAVRRDVNHTFTATQAFMDLHTLQGMTAEGFESGEIEWAGSDLTTHQFEEISVELESRVTELETRVKQIEERVNDVLLWNKDSVISGSKTFTRDIRMSSVLTSSLSVDFADGVNVEKLQSEIYRLDRPRLINGVVTMSQPMTVSGNVNVKQTVNGVDLSEEVMTANTDQYSDASMVFENGLRISGDLNLNGRLGNVNVGAQMVTLDGKHSISGTKSFPDGLSVQNVEASLVDGVNVTHLDHIAFKTSQDQRVTGLYSFYRPLYAQSVFLDGKINGYDVKALSDVLVRVDQQAEVTGTKVFLDDLAVQEALTVGGLLDGCRFPQDFITSSESHVISGRKVFRGKVSAEEVSVMGKINGIKFPEDVVTLTTDQLLSDISFHFGGGITVENDIAVSGLVDGVDISQLAETSLKLNNSDAIRNVTFLGSLTILKNLEVGGEINGVFLEEMIKDMLYKDDRRAVITGPKHFDKVAAESVRVNGLVNGYNLQTDFMTVDEDQEITGLKIFRNPATFRDILTGNNLINHVDVAQLRENLIPFSIKSHEDISLEFTDSSTYEKLKVHGSIEGISFPRDVVLKWTNQTIAGKTFSNDIYVQTMTVEGGAVLSSTFAGVRLQDFETKRMTLSKDEDINGNLVLGNTTAVKVEAYDFENGMDIAELADKIMSLTKDQTVTAPKAFLSHVSVLGAVSSRGINGIHLGEVKKFAFKLHEPNLVSSGFSFATALFVQNLTVHGLANGINLTDLYLDSAKMDGDLQYFRSDNTFAKGFHVEGNILSDEVNGAKLSDVILTKAKPQTIKSKYSFLTSTTIRGDVTIEGLLNGIKLSEMNKLLAKKDISNAVKSNLVFNKPVVITKDIDISGFLNNVDLKTFDSTAKRYIPGHKTLIGNVTVYGDIDVTFVNGENWVEFLNDVVRIDVPQNIHSPKTFLSDVDVIGDIYVSDYASVGYINEMSLQRYQDEAVFTNRPTNISGAKVFSGETKVAGDVTAEAINGLNLKNDVIILQHTDEDVQNLTGPKTFASISVMGNIYVKNLVNGYNLKTLFNDTLMVDEDQEVFGSKTFQSPAMFKKPLFTTTLNGLDVSKDLFTLDTDQEITGNFEFSEDMGILGNLHVNGFLNGLVIEDFARQILYVDTDQIINASFYIRNVSVLSEMTLESPLDQEDVGSFSKDAYIFYNESRRRNNAWNEIVLRQCNTANKLLSFLKSSYNLLDGFMPLQDLNYSDFIEINPEHRELTLFQIEKSGYLASSFKYKYDLANMTFQFVEAGVGNVGQRKTYRAYNHTLIISFNTKRTGTAIELDGTMIKFISLEFHDASALFVDQKFWIALLYPTTGVCEILLLSSLPYGNVEYTNSGSLFVGKDATAVLMFKVSHEVFLAVSRKHDPVMRGSSLIYSWKEGEWQHVQSIRIPSSSNVINFKNNWDDFLVFSDETPFSDSREPMSLRVFRHDGKKDDPFSLFQKIPFNNVLGLDVFQYGGLNDQHLAVYNATVVEVFRLDGESGFTSIFTLRENCITLSKPVLLDGEVFLMVSQKNEFGKHPITLVYKGLTQGLKSPREKLIHCY